MGLKVGWVGYGGNSWMAEELRPIIEELGMELFTLHEHDNADIKWDRHTWLDHLKKADIIIAPANYKKQPAKSANRVTQALSLGKSVICSPLPAYLEVAKKHPGSFLIADTPEEWKERLTLLKNTPSFREQLSKRALEAAKDYSIDAMGKKWEKVLSVSNDAVDTVDIVIPTYKNLRGLKLCLESIWECTAVRYNLIIVNNGDDEDMHNYLFNEVMNIKYIKKEGLNFAQAVNLGIRSGTSKYVMILNDDVIVSRGWLWNMVEACTEKIGAVGLFSNCNKGWLHNYDVNIGGVELLPGSNTYEEIEPIIPQIYEYKSDKTEIKEQEWVAFYATLIPRKVIEEVGYLDENFTNSGEDVDYCKRIRKQGYNIVQTYKSFIFHIGAVSRKILESEDHGSYHEADKSTQAYLKTKYEKETIVLYSGPSWERWDFRNLEQGGIGGSEVWQINLSREIAKLNYRVINFCDCEKEIWEGDIKWAPYTQYTSFIEQNFIDYFISSRTTDPFKYPLRAGKTFVQLHDIWMLSPKEQILLDKVNKFCVLSQWHLDFASDYHKIPKDQMVVMANGIDFNRFDDVKVERHPYRLHWSSSWDRGLNNVLYLFPFIKKEIPEVELHIFYGVHNWKQSCISKNDKKGLEEISKLEKDTTQSGIFCYGRVDQRKLAEEWCKASLWLYPSWFSETFCITAIEGQRAHVPVIANKYAGLNSTLEDSAILLGNGDAWWPYSKEGRDKFLEETVSILKDRDKWQHWSEKGFLNTERYSWQKVALMWQELFKK